MKNALMIFVKYPEPGMVKTRLTPGISSEEASDFHRAIASDIITAHSGCPAFDPIVFFAPPDREVDFLDWLGSATRLEPQDGSDLGEREHNAFTRALGPGDGFGYEKAAVIGTDCPSLDNERIEHVFNLLDHHDVVIGPAADGGYYLMGLSAPRQGLFTDIEWGSPEVLEMTLQAAKKESLDTAMLGKLYDVDTIEDLRRFADDLKRGQIPNLLPGTTLLLKDIFK